jgi:hypothetical protein
LRGARHRGLDIDDAAGELKGLPHSAAEKAIWNARRYALLAGHSTVGRSDLTRAIADVKARPW